MKTTHLALFIGLFLGAALAFGSFTQFFLVVVCGAIGLVVGLFLEGRVSVQGLTDRRGP
ncbi:hypothetical protein BCF74_11234 [Knoellia remsis]|uniref:Small integral membrane protein DUF2273 n=1 Tax=Knoellia remsis TaxID=407159 RepID=A0A2T0UK61_9MICO|nr:hypothetical protein [Knoellia remsis]PRY58217.1 hypothetical protein BCF74_11234 [Knoellia remsis]